MLKYFRGTREQVPTWESLTGCNLKTTELLDCAVIRSNSYLVEYNISELKYMLKIIIISASVGCF